MSGPWETGSENLAFPSPLLFQLNLHRDVASRTGGHQLRSRNRSGVLVSPDGVPVTPGIVPDSAFSGLGRSSLADPDAPAFLARSEI